MSKQEKTPPPRQPAKWIEVLPNTETLSVGQILRVITEGNDKSVLVSLYDHPSATHRRLYMNEYRFVEHPGSVKREQAPTASGDESVVSIIRALLAGKKLTLSLTNLEDNQ